MGTASETDLEAQVLKVLGTIQDPDLHRDIVSLGFIKNLHVKRGLLGSEVSLDIELTTPACPIKEQFRKQAQDLIQQLKGVHKADVRMTAKVVAQKSEKRVPGVRNILAVGSGKGGVGKSTVAVNLALSLKRLGARVGLLDADIYGPSLGLMMGLQRAPLVKNGRILPVEAYGIPVMTFAFFAPVGEAVIWRGAMIGKAVEQMLFEVDWVGSDGNPQREDLDYLVVDLPPGTGDVHLSLIHSVDIAGAVIVSTPQNVALLDAIKGLAMFEKMKVPVLGLVENMSGSIFGSGGTEQRALDRGVPFLGRIPLDGDITLGAEQGHPLVVAHPQHPASAAFLQVAQNVAHQLSLRNLGTS
ncbi:MAG: Mrp/NBP35 family ATP-binding protein [Bdellovibrionales bacterium]|nr:Mrp/NBP35 family ATP-binding protein [Bdellovibrionales bacterium]